MKGLTKRKHFSAFSMGRKRGTKLYFSSQFFTSRNISDFNNDTASAHEKFGVDGFFENQSFVVFFLW